MTLKILVCDELSAKGLEILKAIEGVQTDVKTKLSEEELIKVVPGYQAMVVRSATKVTEKVLDAAKDLRVIARAGMGYDNIDVEAATKKGVVVMNTPGVNAVATAEHSIAMMFALSRNIPQAYASMKDGKWDKKVYTGTEVTGKVLGVIGLGNVGRKVAHRACGLGMKVLGYDPYISEKVAKEAGATVVELDELYKKSDYISVHTVLNETTRGMINAETIEKMKNGVRLINCARGGIIEESDLLAAVESGKVAGAALDVYSTEPLPEDHPLRKHPKVITTPHLGASTEEAQEGVVSAAAEQLKAYLLNDIVINGVNVPAVSREVLVALGSYIDLSRKLGSFLGQVGIPSMKEVQIESSGEILKYDTSPIAQAALRGLMEHLSSEPVNFVNAPVISKERGIRVVESRTEETKSFSSLLTVSVKTNEGEEFKVSGTVVGRDYQRLIRFNQFYLEVNPSKYLLVMRNEDKPGVVGAWGTLLGENKINISQMQVALGKNKKEALAVVNVDTPVPQNVIDELKKVQNIHWVCQIKL